MAGIPVSRNDLNAAVGNTAVVLRDALDKFETLKRWLDDRTDPDLAALGLPAEEIALLRNVVGDLSKLARIAAGQDTQAQASDFWFHARQVLGLN